MQVGLERCGVHRDEHVGLVARRGDLVVGDVDLERRHAVDGARGRADLGREVGKRRQVVAERGAHRGEAVAGELHPVAGVAGEADDEVVEHPVAVRRVRPVDRVGHVSFPQWKSVVGLAAVSPTAIQVTVATRTCRPNQTGAPPGAQVSTDDRLVSDIGLVLVRRTGSRVDQRVAATSKRNEKVAALADVLRRLAPDEVEPAVALSRRDDAARVASGWAGRRSPTCVPRRPRSRR